MFFLCLLQNLKTQAQSINNEEIINKIKYASYLYVMLHIFFRSFSVQILIFYLEFYKNNGLKIRLLFFTIFMYKQEPKQKQIMDILYVNNVDERKFSQLFKYENVIVTHEHTINVQIRSERVEQLTIKNHFPQISQGKVTKVIQISLENKRIRIIDTFTSSMPENLAEQQNSAIKKEMKNPTRVQLMNKRFTKNLLSDKNVLKQLNIRDIKNVVKNIIRLFQSWLQQNTNCKNVLVQLEEILQNSKLNNTLIIKLSQSKLIRYYFLAFCRNIGQTCINNSKIRDKESHLQMLRKYQMIFQEASEDQEGENSDLFHMDSNQGNLVYENN